MAVWFNVRPLKVLAKRLLLDANKVTAASANFVALTNAVAGTRMQFSLAKDSIAEFRVEGNGGGANPQDLDLVIDNVFQATGQKIVAGVVTPAAPAAGFPVHGMRSVALDANFTQDISISWLLDSLAEGVHTFELYAKGTGGAAQINAASTTNPLILTIIEHADTYPPSPSGP